MGSDMWKNCLDCPYHDMEKKLFVNFETSRGKFLQYIICDAIYTCSQTKETYTQKTKIKFRKTCLAIAIAIAISDL